MAAVMLHANKNLGVTDKSCSWSVKKGRKGSISVVPIEKLIQRKREDKEYRALKKMDRSQKLQRLREGLKKCKGAGKSAYWLLSEEPPCTEEPPSTEEPPKQCPHPMDIVLSAEYEEAACDKLNYLKDKLRIDFETSKEIASKTVGQITNPLWTKMRKGLLTASNFGEVLQVYRKKKNTGVPSESLLKKLSNPPKLDRIKVVMWGRNHEKVALKKLHSEYGIEVKSSGLWVHECGFLGASPDGLVGEDAVVEVKCPYSLRNDILSEVLAVKKDYIIYKENGCDWIINKDHLYYHQIQDQLLITRRTLCYLVIWTLKSFVVVGVPVNPDWTSNVTALHEFYCDHFVPYKKASP